MSVNLPKLRTTSFVLWLPKHVSNSPSVVIGQFAPGNPPTVVNLKTIPLTPVPGVSGLWNVAASSCGLTEGAVYHYWFEVTDSAAGNGARILCTDPMASTVDWRLRSPKLPTPYSDDDRDPAAVIKFAGGKLVPCDAAGESIGKVQVFHGGSSNNQLVIYELPTSWASINASGEPQIGVGSFRDVLALVDPVSVGANFEGSEALGSGRSYLGELGINALELLPVTDSFVDREWGYAPSNYFAPDFDLGFPKGNTSPTSNNDLVALINSCHDKGIRFIVDVVMAFGTRAPMENINFDDCHINANSASHSDPDRFQSSRNNETRDGFGGALWRYAKQVHAFDPLSGADGIIFPARQFMKSYLLRWMADFQIDGIRMDSVNNIANWDFVEEFKDLARVTWSKAGGSDDRFIVVGEELSVPLGLLKQRRLDGLWNEDFKRIARNAVLGRNDDEEPYFEWTIRKLIDCRLLGFDDGAQAVNYLGSHDVEGFRNERLYNFLDNNGIPLKEERIKLAFSCLLTAVGIPMIFAGDEFADEHDLAVTHPEKQRDAVNYDRISDPFRARVLEHVSRLVHLRTSSPALGVNDTQFIHADFDHGKRILAWRRGREGSDHQVVVVANFSDFNSWDAGSDEYRVPNWPATPVGKRWREITQARDVPDEWVSREAVFPWEAKVYELV